MLDLDAARATSRRHPLQRLLEPALTITGEGLVLGGTVLAKMERARAGGPALVVDGGEERVLALLAVVYGEAIDHRVLAAPIHRRRIMPSACTWLVPDMPST